MDPVAKLSAIPTGTTHKVVVDRRPILLCNVGGQIFAIEDVCTHDGGELDQGELEGTRIMCPRHGAFFDVTTGAALAAPRHACPFSRRPPRCTMLWHDTVFDAAARGSWITSMAAAGRSAALFRRRRRHADRTRGARARIGLHRQ